MSFVENVNVKFQDSPNLDAFSRLRTSDPFNLFDMVFTYDLQPLFFEESDTGTGTITHVPDEAAVRLSTGGTANGDGTIFQTRQYFRYLPGKALRNGEPVLTPKGWVPIEDISVGDTVFDGLGAKTKVVGVYPQGVRKIYRISFDGCMHTDCLGCTYVDCDEEHLWKTIVRRNKNEGEVRVLTTREMLEEQGSDPTGFRRWKIPAAPVLQIEKRPVPIDPYTLGAVLGDGHIDKNGFVIFTTADTEIKDRIICKRISKYSSKKYAYGVCGLQEGIRSLGLAGLGSQTKFVPDLYKYNSRDVRLATLQGLLDTDGSVDKRCGSVEFTSTSKQLAEDVAFLARSLGGQARIKNKKCHYLDDNGDRVQCSDAYRVAVIIPECPFILERKACYWKLRTQSFDRYVHSIREIGEYEATCIRVASEDYTFLTRDHVVTHNSQFIVFTAALGAKTSDVRKRIGYFDAENGLFFEQDGSNLKIVRRTFTSGSAVDNAVNQSAWNLDRLDGSGGSTNPSGLTLDETNDNIFIIDFQWLGAGRTRFGLDLGGEIVYCHEIDYANTAVVPYMTTGSLPFRAEIFNTALAGGTTTFDFFCVNVSSEGGFNPLGIPGSVQSTALRTVTAANDPFPLISIRPRVTFNAITNRGLILPISFGVMSEDATVRYELILNGTLTNESFADVDTTNSLAQVDVAADAISGGVVIDSGFVSGAQTARESGTTNRTLLSMLALANDIAGTTTDILSLVISIINSAGTASDCGGAFTWTELR